MPRIVKKIIPLFFIAALSSRVSGDFFDKSYALVIGIGDYSSKSRLPYARNDAADMVTYLKSKGYILKTLYDKEATKATIISSMQDLAKNVTKNDRVLIFFSGHGHTEPFGDKDYGYLVPYDGTNNSATYISMEELTGLADKMKNTRHLLFIIDACYAGLLQTKDDGLDINLPNYLKEITRRDARQILVAGGKKQAVLAQGEGKNSYFTSYLIKALKNDLGDLNSDGFITLTELSAYLETSASNKFQTPTCGILPGHELGNFVFTASKGIPPKPQVNDPYPSPTVQFKGSNAIFIKSGTFMMGSNNGDADEQPVHKMTVKGFYMDNTEVTNEEYNECVEAGKCTSAFYNDGTAFIRNGDTWKKGVVPEEFRTPSHPVVAVTWEQAKKYCEWKGNRLPTEAEWEYAARGGNTSDYFWGDDGNNCCRYANAADSTAKREYAFRDIINCNDNHAGTAPVGELDTNWFGLHDMIGNVWEWCEDQYDLYTTDDKKPPQETRSNPYRVIRGGAWCDTKEQLRSANRRWTDAENRNIYLGFRCVREEDE